MVAALCAGVALEVSAAEQGQFKDEKDKTSYALGLSFGKQLKQNDIEINFDGYLKGIKDGLAGQAAMTDEQLRETMTALNQQVRAKSMEKQKADQEKSKKAGEAYLAENKKKEGVTTTPSGLQYKVLTKGTGKIPTTNDTVVCHYRGTLIDGTEFDSSYKKGEPTEFPVTRVIPGWTEALQLMPVGSKWQLVIPSNIAYGERGNPRIPGGSTLLFDIELIDIKKPEPVAAKPK